MCDKFGIREATKVGPIIRVRHSNFKRGELHHTIYPNQAIPVDDWVLPAAVSIELNDELRSKPSLWLHGITVTWCGSIEWSEELESLDKLFRTIERKLGITKGTSRAELSRERLATSLDVSQRLLNKVAGDLHPIREYTEYADNVRGAVVASHGKYELVSSEGVKLPDDKTPVDDEQIQAIDRPAWFENLTGENHSYIHGIYTPVTELVGV